jgi:hypothetical protein
MKLTKGKIRKLYNKRNQTLKKYKNKKTSYEKKTFRNKKQLNLARKTLKRFAYEKPRGGANEVAPKDKSKGFFSFLGRKAKPIDPTKSTTLENAKPPAQVTEDIKTPAVDIAVTTTTDQPITPVTPVTPVAVEPAITTTDQPITTDQPAITTTDQPITTDQPAVTTDQPAVTTDQPTTDQPAVTESVSITTDQPITDQPAITESVSTTTDTPVAVEPAITESVSTTTDTPVAVEPAITTDQPAVTESVSITTDTPVAVEPAITESVSTTTDQPPTTAVEPTVKEDTKNIPSSEIPSSEIPSSEITNSLSKVTNYFANVIADKVSQNISAINTKDKLQDGFVSVNKAAEKMASSGGKKYKKTKRFRLTHNKTRQQR